MSRLIDADKLKRDMLDLPNCYNGFSDAYDKACIICLIDEQPTIDRPTDDMVEVVRCNDCAYYEPSEHKGYTGEGWCCFFDSTRRDDAFCSSGERKDE